MRRGRFGRAPAGAASGLLARSPHGSHAGAATSVASNELSNGHQGGSGAFYRPREDCSLGCAERRDPPARLVATVGSGDPHRHLRTPHRVRPAVPRNLAISQQQLGKRGPCLTSWSAWSVSMPALALAALALFL